MAELKKIYIVVNVFNEYNHAVFDNKEQCIDFVFKYYIEDNEEIINELCEDYLDAPQKDDNDEIDFNKVYKWIKKTLNADIQTFNGYDFAIDVLYLNNP